MLDITIYDKKGCRHFIDHVNYIATIKNDVIITTITDFNDHITRTFHIEEIELIKATVMKGVN